MASSRNLTIKLSHPGPKDVNRDSGTKSANPGWLQRLVERTFRSLLQVEDFSLRGLILNTAPTLSMAKTP
jgi:hypothetical protein